MMMICNLIISRVFAHRAEHCSQLFCWYCSISIPDDGDVDDDDVDGDDVDDGDGDDDNLTCQTSETSPCTTPTAL